VSLEVLVEILHNTGSEMEVTANSPVLDALDSEGDLAKESKLDSTVADLLALEVSHLDSELLYQQVINVGGDGRGHHGGEHHGEGAALVGEHELLVLVAVVVAHSGGGGVEVWIFHRWFTKLIETSLAFLFSVS